MGLKKCNQCETVSKKLFRVKHLQVHYAKKEWIFVCEDCLNELKPNNPHYQYGGTWKG
jgi:hypothetical protein